MFLTDEGYNEVITADGQGNVKIIRHATVRMGELINDAPNRGEQKNKNRFG